MSETPNFSRITRARTLRAALLGAVAMAGVGGFATQASALAVRELQSAKRKVAFRSATVLQRCACP